MSTNRKFAESAKRDHKVKTAMCKINEAMQGTGCPSLAAQVAGACFIQYIAPVVGAKNLTEGKSTDDIDAIQEACDAVVRDIHNYLGTAEGKSKTALATIMLMARGDSDEH